MMSPLTDSADEATKTFLDSIVLPSSPQSGNDNVDDFDSVPLSPELGMGIPRGSEVDELELEGLEGQTTAHAESTGSAIVAQQSGGATSGSHKGEGVEKLPRSYQIQQSLRERAQKANSSSGDVEVMKSAPTCPPTRRSARVKSTLVYDQKYHPLDDVIRPSHAAKRRIIHGEQPLMASGSNGETPEELGSDVGSAAGDEDGDDGDLQPTPIRKRKRARPLTSKPIRHSSHRRSKPKTSYNMKLHPQDSDLKRVWACDGSKSSPSPTMEIFPAEAITSTNKTPSKEVQELYGTTLEGESEDSGSEPAPEVPDSPARYVPAPDLVIQREDRFTSDHQALRQQVGHSSADQDAWPAVKGLPFQIFTESMEGQMSAEAEVASPFHYEDDDKENDVTNPELMPRPNTLDGIFIIPASHYHRQSRLYTISNASSVAVNAFYVQPQIEAEPYGLGWSDGAHDAHNSGGIDCLASGCMQTLTSGEYLPRQSTPATDSRLRGDNGGVTSSPVADLGELECIR